MPKEKKTNEPLSLKQQAAKIQGLQDKVTQLNGEVKRLKDVLNVGNVHTEMQKLIGSEVAIGKDECELFFGKLEWVDRYHFKVGKRIFPKSQYWISGRG